MTNLAFHPESSAQLPAYAINNYIRGGRGAVTLKSPSGKHHTYMFSRPRNPNEFPEDILFVYAVHDHQKLFYVGMVERNQFRITQYSRFDSNSEIAKGAAFIMRWANNPNMKTSMILYHEGVCGCCGRKLTSPKSIECGIGPRCRKLMKEKKEDII